MTRYVLAVAELVRTVALGLALVTSALAVAHAAPEWCDTAAVSCVTMEQAHR